MAAFWVVTRAVRAAKLVAKYVHRSMYQQISANLLILLIDVFSVFDSFKSKIFAEQELISGH